MIAGTLLVFVGFLLLVYWFRYTCFMILAREDARRYSKAVADANGLTFVSTQSRLRHAAPDHLEQIRQSLDRDFLVVTSLLRHSVSFGPPQRGAYEQMLLRADYRLLQFWYMLVHTSSGRLARQSLQEMTKVVACLAHSLGQRTASVSRI